MSENDCLSRLEPPHKPFLSLNSLFKVFPATLKCQKKVGQEYSRIEIFLSSWVASGLPAKLHKLATVST